MLNRKYDFFKNRKINYNELSNEIKIEISILGGLDIFTDSHVKGVVDTTTKICDEMNMPYDELKKCVLAAYLHDVGKILIPSEILQKNSRLTDDEYKKMREHVVFSYEICMKYNEFKNLAPIVRAHHENLDGSGYPDGLKGEQIPFEASIIKVADVYDALIRKRQYKEEFKKSDAIAIMMRNVREGKMCGKILCYLIESILSDLKKSLDNEKNIVEEYKNNIDILHELEDIYKQIYDEGYSKRLAKKLERYELQPGYDMSTNANLLINKQRILEKENNKYDDLKNEFRKISTQLKELRRVSKDEVLYKYII